MKKDRISVNNSLGSISYDSYNGTKDRPKIDIVLQTTGFHGWNFSQGWINTLKREKLIHRIFDPIAEWGAQEPSNDDGLFEYLENPQADIMLLLGI